MRRSNVVWASVAALLINAVGAGADWHTFVIRNGSTSGLPPVIQDVTQGGIPAKEFIIAEAGQKAAWGVSALDGYTVGDIGRLAVVRLDDRARFSPGSGPYVAPYFNIWITNGDGKYAVLANEPSDAVFQPLYDNGYDLTWEDIADKPAKVYENSDKSWLPNNGVGLTFANVAAFAVQAPTPAELAAGWPGLGTGAPRELGTNIAYGFNWVLGDTLSNYVSGDPGYILAQPAAAGPPTEVWVDDDYCATCENDGHIWGYDAFTTIQEGIDAVVGSTIYVAAGTYNQRLTINKSLTLLGAQTGVDPTESGTRLDPSAESIVTKAGLAYANPDVLIDIVAGVCNVVIDGFTLIGDPDQTNADTCVVRAGNPCSNLAITRNIVDGRFGVIFKGGTSLEALDNRMTVNATGVVVQPNPAADLRIIGNVFERGAAPVSDAKGIYLTGVTNAELKDNVVDAFPWDALAGSNVSQAVISGNVLTGCRKGISLWGNTTYISINENDLSDSLINGIEIKGQHVLIEDNQIVSCGEVAIKIDKHTLDTQDVNIASNDLSGAGNHGLVVTAAVAETVNAEHNYWGTINPAGVAAVVSGNADYTPWCNADFTRCDFDGAITDAYIDDDYIGLADGTAVDWPYTGDNGPHYIGYDAFATVQAGVNAVGGSTVYVAAGVYVEQVHITLDNLNLIGAGIDQTVIKSPAALPLYFMTGTTKNYPVVFVDGATGVSISNLTIDGDHQGDANYRFSGLSFWNAGGFLSQAKVLNVMNSTFSGAQHGVGVYAYNNTGGPYTIALSDVLVDEFQKTAIALSGAGLTVDVVNVTCIGEGPTAVTAQNGIQVSYGASGTISECAVSGVAYTGASWTASGLLFMNAGTIDVTDTAIESSQTSVYFQDCSGTVERCAITNPTGDGLIAYSYAARGDVRVRPQPYDDVEIGGPDRVAMSIAVANSDIIGTGAEDSWGTYAYAANGTITYDVSNCRIQGWTYGVVPYEAGATVVATITENSITGCDYAIGAGAAETQNASGNWYGVTAPAAVAALIDGPIDYTPWLGVDGQYTTPGFIGDFSLLYVDDDSPQTGTLGRIQEAIDLVDGSTVNVAAGMYEERLVIGKSITLLGPTANVSKVGYAVPAGYAWDTSVEAVVSYPDPTGLPQHLAQLIDVFADDVVVKGFVFQVLNARHAFNGDNLFRVNAQITDDPNATLDGIVIENNVLGPATNVTFQDGTAGRMNLYLASPSYPAQRKGITNSSIKGNKIFGALGNGNNVFVWGSATGYNSLERADFTGTVIESNEIFGSQRSGIEIAGGAKGLTIRNNRIHGNSSVINGGSADPNLKYGNGIVVIRMGADKTNCDAWGADELTVVDNEVYDNEKYGVYFGPINGNHTLTGNSVHDNGLGGVHIDLDEMYYGGSWPCYNATGPIVMSYNSIYDNGVGASVAGTPTNGFVLDATNNWWGHISGPYDPSGSIEADVDNCQDPSVMKNEDGQGDGVSDHVDYCPWLAPRLFLRVAPSNPACYSTEAGGDVVTVEIVAVDFLQTILGGQFNLQYDESKLTFSSAAAGDYPFTQLATPCYDPPGDGELYFAVSLPLFNPPPGYQSPDPIVIGRVAFTTASQACDLAGLVNFTPNPPINVQTRLTQQVNGAATPLYVGMLEDLPGITIDWTKPVLSEYPLHTTVECDAVPMPPTITATDNCDDDVPVQYDEVRTDGSCPDSYTLTRTWTATDDCDNQELCVQVITVRDTTAPSLNAYPANAIVECDAVPTPPTITAMDNCDDDVPVQYAEVRTDGSCPDSYTLTRTWTAVDDCGNEAVHSQIITVQDTTPPTFTRPADITRNADAGSCSLTLSETEIGEPTDLADNCSLATNPVSWVRSDHAANLDNPFGQGATTITWTVTDACGNEAQQIQTITVLGYNDFVVDLEIQGSLYEALPAGQLTRCITFTFYDCGGTAVKTFQRDVVFTSTGGSSGLATGVLINEALDCGSYDCVTVNDELHSLTRRTTPTVVNSQYFADFTGANMLLQGDFYDDTNDWGVDFIDIVDFGVFIAEYGATYDSDGDSLADGNTPCGVFAVHADANGDGVLDVSDYSFVTANFMALGQTCCTTFSPLTCPMPRTSITVRELREMGLGRVAAFDLNRDGVFDMTDVSLFLQGVQPTPEEPKARMAPEERPRQDAGAALLRP